MLPRILIVTLCCTLLSCKSLVEKYKRSNSGVSALDKKVLYDFRDYGLRIRASARPSPAGPAECRLGGTEDGSFTYAAEDEQASLFQCGVTNKLIVFSRGTVQATSDTPYSKILASFDLNHDDKQEILLGVESVRDGELIREASLETFEKNSLRSVENFGIVYRDPCRLFIGADETKNKELVAKGLSPYVEAVLVSYLPRPGHEMAAFSAQRLRAPCPAAPGGALTGWQSASPR